MLCPVCRNPMVVVEYQKIELDYCTNCEGVWFDCGELELLLKAKSSGETCLPEKGVIRSSDVKTAEKKRKCPICGRKMAKNLIGEKPEVLIDACPVGEGLFFDGGEVDALLHQVSPEKVASDTGSGRVLTFLKDVFQGKK